MSQDRSELNELHLPAAASGALQLSRRLAQPAAWAERLSARERPLVVGSFGAEITRRFGTVSAPGTLALSLAERFLPSESQSSAGELTLAPRGSAQHDVGVARWSAPLVPSFTTNAAAPALVGELSAFGWGTPASAASARPSESQNAEAPPALPAATPDVTRHAAAPPALPLAAPIVVRRTEQAAAQPIPHQAAHPTAPPDPIAPAASGSVRRQPDDLPASTPQDQASTSDSSVNASTDAAQSSPPATASVQRSEIPPEGAPALISRATRSQAARSAEATPAQAPTGPLPALPASNAAAIARVAAPERRADLSLLFLRPTVLRSTALLRSLPPDPLRRMGVLPQGADLTAAPPVERMPPAGLAARLPLAQAAAGVNAPAEPASAPVARRADAGIEEALPLAPHTPATLQSADAPDLATAAGASEVGAQPSAAPMPAPDIARAPAVPEIAHLEAMPAPEIARSEAIVSPAAVAPQSSAILRAATSSAAPISLTTLVLRRHAAGNPASGSAPLILLRTRPASAALLRAVPEIARRDEAIRRMDTASAASEAGFAAPSIGRSAFEASSISRSAALIPFPLARMPEQGAAHALPLSIPDLPAAGPAGAELALAPVGELNAPATSRVLDAWPLARVADEDAFPHTSAGELSTPMASRAADPGPLAPVADWGAFPLLQRSAATASLAQQTGGSVLLRRRPAGGELPAAMSIGLPRLAATVWRSGDMRSSSSSADPSQVASGALSGSPSGDGGYVQWSIPELALEQPRMPVARLADLDDDALPHQQLAMVGGDRRSAAPAYASQSLDLAQPIHAEVQRASSDISTPASPQPDAAQAPDTAQQSTANIEVIAQKVYEHLRRRLLIEHERRGRLL